VIEDPMAGTHENTDATKRVEIELPLGLGDAVLRLIHVEEELQTGVRSVEGQEALIRERNLLLEALNRYPLHLAFDCDGDGLPDTGTKPISIFEASAMTSCCRILPKTSDRKKPTARKKVSSRKPAARRVDRK
jgi:hypothetical protein